VTDVDTPPPDATEAAFAAMLDMAAPQERYAAMVREKVVMPMPGVAVPASRAAVDTVLRHHEVFTSEFGLDLGNIRPLIPLSVDPPRHAKSVRAEEDGRAGGGHRVAGQPLHRRLHRER
jgi:hypothetical protein